MENEVNRGRGGVDIDGKIANYLRDPKKNKSDKTKALKSIESQVKSMGELIVSLQAELEQSYMKMQMGEGVLDGGRVTEIEGKIVDLKKNLSTLNVQLAKLAKYKKSHKLAGRVLASSIALTEVESEIQLIKEAKDNELPKVAQLRGEINSILDKASKKTNRKQSGELLEKAIRKYSELEKERDQFDEGSVEYRQIDADMRAIRVRMTVIVDKRVKLSKSEQKFYNKYPSGKRTTKKDEKWRLLKARSDVISQFSRDTSSPLREKPGGVSSRGDDDSSLTSSDVPRRRQGETVESRLSDHRLSKREKLRTKVSVTPWQKIRHGELVTIARSSHKIGKQQMRTMAVLSQAQTKYQSGEYSSIQLREDLAEVKSIIADTEAKLAGLQAEAAAKGSSKFSKKVEEAIVSNRTILASLRAKEADLETIADDNYADASKRLQLVRKQVSHAIENPKEAGPAMYKAYVALGILQSLSIPSPGSGGVSRVDQEIAGMHQVAQALIASARSEGVLSLTRTEHNFLIDLVNGAETRFKVKNTEKNYDRLVTILSKKYALAKYGETNEKVEALCEIAIILKYLSENNPNLLRSLGNNPELNLLFSLYYDDSLFKKAPNFHYEALQALAKAKAEPERAPYHIHAAYSKLQELKSKQSDNPQINDIIEEIVYKVKKRIVSSSKKSLRKSSNLKKIKKPLSQPLQAGTLSKKQAKKVEQVRQVLANEIMIVMLGHLKERDSSLGELLDDLEKNPILRDKVMEDPQIHQLHQDFLAQKQIHNALEPTLGRWAKYKSEQLQVAAGTLIQPEQVKRFTDQKVLEHEELFNIILADAHKLIGNQRELSPIFLQLEKLSADIERFLRNPEATIEEALEQSVEFRTVDDFLGIAQGVVVQALVADEIRKPPEEFAVNNLLIELKRLQKFDRRNKTEWEALAQLVNELNQAYIEVGETFKPLYEPDGQGSYQFVANASLSPTQVAKLAAIMRKQEEIVNRIQAINFADSSFSQLHEAYPPLLVSNLGQRGKALAALNALPKQGGTVTEPARPEAVARTVPESASRVGPPPVAVKTSPTLEPLPPPLAETAPITTVPVAQQTARLYQQAFNVSQVVGSPYPNTLRALTDEISRRSDADPANKEQWGVMLNAVNEFAKVYREVGTVYEDLYDEHGAIRQDVSLTPTQARFVDWMANEIHSWLTGQIDAVKFRPTDQTQFQQAHIQGFNNMLAGFKQSVDALNRLPRTA